MADQATIFTGDNPTSTESAAAQAVTTSTATQAQAEMVAALVGEGKKYKTVDDLAKAYVNADSFIETLKAENRELKEKVTAARTVDEVLDRLQQQQTRTTTDPSAPSVSDITKLVEQTVTGLETQKAKTSNLKVADQKMKEMFGEKAGEIFNSAATTPELRKVYMDLAAADPDKFVKMFTDKPATSVGVDAGGGVNTTVQHNGPSNRASVVGTKDFYDNVRRTNPSLYYSQDFQVSMDKTVRSNPDLYYGKRN
jgi:predicted kinase